MKKSRNPHKCVVSRLLTESDRRGSNPRSRPWQGRALPTTPLSHIMTVPFQNSHYFTLFTVCCQSFFTKIPQQLFFLQLFFLQFYKLLFGRLESSKTTTITSGLHPSFLIRSISNSTNLSPAFTSCPLLTKDLNPFPSNLTVSIPI